MTFHENRTSFGCRQPHNSGDHAAVLAQIERRGTGHRHAIEQASHRRREGRRHAEDHTASTSSVLRLDEFLELSHADELLERRLVLVLAEALEPVVAGRLHRFAVLGPFRYLVLSRQELLEGDQGFAGVRVDGQANYTGRRFRGCEVAREGRRRAARRQGGAQGGAARRAPARAQQMARRAPRDGTQELLGALRRGRLSSCARRCNGVPSP